MNTIRTEILKLLETRSTPRAIYPGDDQYPMLRCLLEENLPEEVPLEPNLGLLVNLLGDLAGMDSSLGLALVMFDHIQGFMLTGHRHTINFVQAGRLLGSGPASYSCPYETTSASEALLTASIWIARLIRLTGKAVGSSHKNQLPDFSHTHTMWVASRPRQFYGRREFFNPEGRSMGSMVGSCCPVPGLSVEDDPRDALDKIEAALDLPPLTERRTGGDRRETRGWDAGRRPPSEERVIGGGTTLSSQVEAAMSDRAKFLED